MRTSVQRLTGLLALVLTSLGWLIPNHHLPWPGFFNDFAAAAGLAAICFCAAIGGAGGGGRLVVPRTVWPVLAVACVPWAQWIFGQIRYFGDALLPCIYLVGFAIAQMVGTRWGREDRGDALSAAAACLVAVSCLSVGLQFCQWLRVEGLGIFMADLAPGGRPHANIAQPNLLATLLVLGLLATAYLYETGRVSGLECGALSVWIASGVVLTESRTGLVELIAAAVLTAALTKRTSLRLSPSAYVLLLGGIGLAWLSLPAIKQAVSGPDHSAPRVLTQTRLEMWREFASAIFNSPWIGYGWGQGAVAQAAGVSAHASGVEASEYAHNIALDLMAWNGVPLGVMVLIAGLLWYAGRVQTACCARDWWAMASLTALGAHACTEYPHAYAFFLLPAGYFVGLAEARRPGRSLPSSAWLGLGLGCALALVITASDYWHMEQEFRQLRMELARVGTDRVRESVPDVLVTDQLQAHVRVIRRPIRPDWDATSLEEMGFVARRFPFGTTTIRYVMVLAVNGRLEQARAEMQRYRYTYGDRAYARAKNAFRELSQDEVPALARLELP